MQRMRIYSWAALVWLFSLFAAGFFAGDAFAKSGNAAFMLKHGWSVRSEAGINKGGEALSRPGIDTSGWYSTSVPATVMAVLAASGEYPDPYYGMNMVSWPGSLPPKLDMSTMSMPPASPFRKAWWYRKEFELPEEYSGRTVWLHFDGINYSANIWLNGVNIADSSEAAGAFRIFEFDITSLARPGEVNVLAVEINAPRHRDLSFAWVDWNPAPPDRNMGLWRDVYITTSGPVALRHPHVVSELETPSMKKARLTVTVDAKNATDMPVSGTLKGRIGEITFSKKVELEPLEEKAVVLAAEEYPQLELSNPRLWWPYHLGPQNLYDLELEFSCGGKVSDKAGTRFGIREITSELTEDDWLLFRLNGRKLLIRGAAWCPDMMLRFSRERVAAELRYVKEMNLNAIRLEGKLETNDVFYEMCDEMGILVMPGWCCCHQWERWRTWDDEDYVVAEASQRDQAKRLRSHPSVMAWLYGSDYPPPADVETTYLDVLEECMWPNPGVSCASERAADITGKSGIKMRGPYDYVPPVYWYTDTRRGGAFGFCAETGPGPAVPPIESLRLFIPEDHLWPIDNYWNYHAGRTLFSDIKVFSKALDARYGKAKGAEDYAMKAQAMTYDGQRAMFEAFGRNKYDSTGVIQWMLNDAWPSLIWHLYDSWLRPAGGYYGTKKACEPLHVQYSYDDRSVVVVNGLWREFSGLEVSAQVYNLDMTEKFSRKATVGVGADSITRAFVIPELTDLSTTWFLKLDMTDSKGRALSTNFYWLSTRPDVLAWRRGTFTHTPTKSDADLTGLNDLPAVELEADVKHEARGDVGTTRVTLRNPSPHLAFMVCLKVEKAGGEEVLPVFWQDNYFPVMPGEVKTVSAEYSLRNTGEAGVVLAIEGWNVRKVSY